MIGERRQGPGFGGLTRYLLHGKDGQDPDRVAWVSLRNLRDGRSRAGRREMGDHGGAGPAGGKARLPPVDQLAPREELAREQWEEVVDRVLADLGLQEHQVDGGGPRRPGARARPPGGQPGPPRAAPGVGQRATTTGGSRGRCGRSSGSWGCARCRAATTGSAGQERPEPAEGRTPGERRQAERTGAGAVGRSSVRREAAATCGRRSPGPSWSIGSRGRGCGCEARGRGMVVTDGEREVKASRVSRAASRGRLEERFGQRFAEWRELRREFLAEVQAYQVNMARRDGLEGVCGAAGVDGIRARDALEDFRKIQRESTATLRRIDGHLARAYRPEDVARARRDLLRVARRLGWERTAQALRDRPERFGRLRGSALGRVETAARKAARAAVRGAAGQARRSGRRGRRCGPPGCRSSSRGTGSTGRSGARSGPTASSALCPRVDPWSSGCSPWRAASALRRCGSSSRRRRCGR